MAALGAITGLSTGWAIGAGAVALAPLLVHLLARGRARRVVFAGQRFLAEVAARGRRASRPRDVATLALRIAALACIALAFAGLAWSSAQPATTTETVIVLDASASMTRLDAGRSVFERARQRALERLDDPALRRAGVVIARAAPVALLPQPTANLDALRARLRTVEPTLEGADLASAVALAHSLAPDGAPARIVVLTDAQGAASLADAGDAEVVACDIHAWQENTAIVDLAIDGAEAVVTIERWGDASAPLRVRFEVNGAPVASIELDAPPGRTVVAADLPTDLPAWSVVRANLEPADSAPWDDARYTVVPAPVSIAGGIVTDASGGPSARILAAAINPFGTPDDEPALGRPGALPDAPILAITGAGAWTVDALDDLARRLRAGAGAIWVIDDAAAHDSLRAFLARHAPAETLALGEAFERAGMWTTVGADAPWLALADGLSLLDDIETIERSPVHAAPPDAVAMRFDDGAPALVRTPIGRGALVTLHLPIDPSRSTIARTPALPIIINAAFEALAPAPARIADARTGAPLPIDTGARSIDSAAPLRDSLDRPVTVGAPPVAQPLDAPGPLLVYSGEAIIGGATAHTDDAESVPAQGDTVRSAPSLDRAAMATVSTPLAPWLLLAAVALLLVEAFLARRQGATP
jgi:hypothetical protein